MDDSYYLTKALELAEKGKGKTSPNPLVGALLVKEEKIIGQGYHKKAGLPHAEITALREATTSPKDSTLYINLEPCTHHGRTPPCVDAIIKAQVKRVVASMEDPNPLVNGKGFAQLKKHGIQVDVGLLKEKAENLNEAFIYYIKHKLPFVLIKAGLTLNGKLSPLKGKKEQITGAESREYVHQLRKEYDAIMVGVNTILIDDPLLTARPSNEEGTPLLRVILDSKLRTPPQARIFQAQDGGSTLIFTSSNSPKEARRALEEAGAEIIEVGHNNDMINLKEVLRQLGTREIMSLIIEGGPKLITTALREALAQKIIFIFAPKIFAHKKSLPLIDCSMLQDNHNLFHFTKMKSFPLGEDIAIEAYMKQDIKQVEY
jgi:diaminohydroxyphosphoribosylaminopyrimidine deaminase/5-amino-6-(5-phosphoribosylamino)uracil reductase